MESTSSTFQRISWQGEQPSELKQVAEALIRDGWEYVEGDKNQIIFKKKESANEMDTNTNA